MFHTSKGSTGNAGRGTTATRIGGLPVRQQRLQPPRDAERELLIRLAGPDDRPALDRLAGLDSQAPLQGDALIAKLDGVAVAALSLRDGRLVADPFKRTAAIGDHLRLRASSMTATTAPAAPLFKRLLRIVPARAAWLSEGSR
jgi:sirohydrochlorin ferrochelatase